MGLELVNFETKTCSRCRKTKLISDFRLMRGDNFRRRSRCIDCNEKQQKLRKNTDGGNGWKRANREKVESARLRYLYGITIDQRAEMAIRQGHRCASCRRERQLFVDHCHNTGRVRALLCRHCNTALGLLDDNPLMVSALLEYIRGH